MSSSDIPGIEHRVIGHPKERFPLTIYAEPAPSKSLGSAIQDALAQWNEVFEQVFHLAAFTWSDNQASAEVLIRFAKESSVRHEMGDPTSTLMARHYSFADKNQSQPAETTWQDRRSPGAVRRGCARAGPCTRPTAYQPGEFDHVLRPGRYQFPKMTPFRTSLVPSPIPPRPASRGNHSHSRSSRVLVEQGEGRMACIAPTKNAGVAQAVALDSGGLRCALERSSSIRFRADQALVRESCFRP